MKRLRFAHVAELPITEDSMSVEQRSLLCPHPEVGVAAAVSSSICKCAGALTLPVDNPHHCSPHLALPHLPSPHVPPEALKRIIFEARLSQPSTIHNPYLIHPLSLSWFFTYQK